MKNYYLQSAKIIILGLVVGLGVSMISAAPWQGPGSNPPSGNKEAPINVSTDPQAKGGDYITGTLLDINGLFTANDIAVANRTLTNQLEVLGNAKIESLNDVENPSATFPAPVCANSAGYLVLCAGSGGGGGSTQVAPQFTSYPNLVVIKGQGYSYTPIATGTPSPSISLVSTVPSWLSFNGTYFSGVPPMSTPSNTTVFVTIKASNGVSPDATQTFSITIADTGSATYYYSNTTQSWQVPLFVNQVNAIVVGGSGGGGGGGYMGVSGGAWAGAAGGGGGAGGVYKHTISVNPGQTFTINVGAKGQAGSMGTVTNRDGQNGTDGANTSLATPVGTFVAAGGKGGKGGLRGCSVPNNSSIPCSIGGAGGLSALSQYTAGTTNGAKGADSSSTSGVGNNCAVGGAHGVNMLASSTAFTHGGRGGDGKNNTGPGNVCNPVPSNDGLGGMVILTW